MASAAPTASGVDEGSTLWTSERTRHDGGTAADAPPGPAPRGERAGGDPPGVLLSYGPFVRAMRSITR
ncbi:hypothetical protein [Actinomadura litoris]|uniref:Uncharacterized protein n=1 Tax=Actinomadura litoris TaxID=2678616 RepID=A0A7K1L970_9ACTN|nr:hypothetical protein [Actinomadura litoris]MUN40969.1 hypothetical protein [Actinomadura litoris]